MGINTDGTWDGQFETREAVTTTLDAAELPTDKITDDVEETK